MLVDKFMLPFLPAGCQNTLDTTSSGRVPNATLLPLHNLKSAGFVVLLPRKGWTFPRGLNVR